jgi:hypothetical protein
VLGARLGRSAALAAAAFGVARAATFRLAFASLATLSTLSTTSLATTAVHIKLFTVCQATHAGFLSKNSRSISRWDSLVLVLLL